MNNVVVTIANWNGMDFLEPCLQSLFAQTLKPYKVIIIDNGSTDGSNEWIQKHYPNITLIELDHNTGFAFPHTLAISEALKDEAASYILTLNNDTELTPTFIEEMVACAQKHPDAGGIQGKILHASNRDLIECVGVLIHPDMSGFNKGQKQKDSQEWNEELEIMGPSASAALYTRKSLEVTALPRPAETVTTKNGDTLSLERDYFDRRYFAYYEDVDLLWRMRLAGFSSWYTPKAIAYHHHSGTGITASPFKAFHIHRNHFYNIIKDAPLPFLLIAALLLPIRYIMLVLAVLKGRGAASRLSQNVQKGIDSNVSNIKKGSSQFSMIGIVLRAWKETLQALPLLLRDRWHIQKMRTASWRAVRRWFQEYRVNWQRIFFE